MIYAAGQCKRHVFYRLALLLVELTPHRCKKGDKPLPRFGLGFMSKSTEKIARSYFSTSALSGAQKFDAWRDTVSALFDVKITPNTPAKPFDSEIETYMLGNMLVMQTKSSSQAFQRTSETIARDGVDHILVQLFTEGGNTLFTEDGPIKVLAGDIQVLDMAQPVVREAFGRSTPQATGRNSYSAITLVLGRDSMEAIIPMVHSLHQHVLRSNTPLNILMRDYIRSLYHSAPLMTRAEGNAIVRPTIELLATTLSHSKTHHIDGLHDMDNALLLTVRKFIDNNLHDPKLGPSTILAHIGISRSALFRVCKHHGGVMTLIRDRRLLMARRLLSQESTNTTVKMIAYKLGFSNPSNFARTYKQCYGFSPSDTRGLHLEKPDRENIASLENLMVGDRKWEYWVTNMVL